MQALYSTALCRYLRRPPLQGLRVWADPAYQEAVRKLGNHMRAAAELIERCEQHIEYLEMMASIGYRVPVYPEAVVGCGVTASCDTQPKAGDVKQAPLVSGAVTNEVRQTPPPSDLSTDKDG